MTENNASRAWMPVAGGVLSIVAGALGLLGSIVWLVFGNIIASHITHAFHPSTASSPWGGLFIIYGIISLFSVIFDILAIIGGIFAIQRKYWGWALAGSISAAITSHIMGVVSLVFIALSRKEFK